MAKYKSVSFLFSAFLFMFILVLFANLFSDVVRDAFDPRKTFS